MEDFRKYITFNPNVRFGKPSLIGTRITVADVLGWLGSGMTNDEILSDFPELKKEHILAVLQFAAKRESIIKTIAA